MSNTIVVESVIKKCLFSITFFSKIQQICLNEPLLKEIKTVIITLILNLFLQCSQDECIKEFLDTGYVKKYSEYHEIYHCKGRNTKQLCHIITDFLWSFSGKTCVLCNTKWCYNCSIVQIASKFNICLTCYSSNMFPFKVACSSENPNFSDYALLSRFKVINVPK